MNVVQEIQRINQREFDLNIWGGHGASWHDEYRESAWVYVGGLSTNLSEGDVICVMSQWGEIEDINLVREKATNKSQGFAFVKYEDQRSTILAVDNFNGIELLGRTMRVDHVHTYKLPKEVRERETKMLEEDPNAEIVIGPGHAYKDKTLMNEFDISRGQDLWAKPSPSSSSSSNPGAEAGVGDGSRKRSRWSDRDEAGGDSKSVRKEEKKTQRKEQKERQKAEKKMAKSEKKAQKEMKEKRDKKDRKDKKEMKNENESKRAKESDKDDTNSAAISSSSSSSFAARDVVSGGGACSLSWMGSRDPKLSV